MLIELKYNPYHDEQGHFAEGPGGVSSSHIATANTEAQSTINSVILDRSTPDAFTSDSSKVFMDKYAAAAKEVSADELAKSWNDEVKAGNVEARMRVKEATLSKVLDSGEFKNQFETGTSGGGKGTSALAQRAEIENKLFGQPTNDASRPKYGYFALNGEESHMALEQYGGARVHFKQNVLDKATMTDGDSLDQNIAFNKVAVAATPVKNTGGGSFRRDSYIQRYAERGTKSHSTAYSYMEAQYHGKLTVGDISKVVFTGKAPSAALIKKLEKHNIPFSHEPTAKNDSVTVETKQRDKISALEEANKALIQYIEEKYSPDQERDDHGRFGSGGSSTDAHSATFKTPAEAKKYIADMKNSGRRIDFAGSDGQGGIRVDVAAAGPS